MKASILSRWALAGEQNASSLIKEASVGGRCGGSGGRRKKPLCLEGVSQYRGRTRRKQKGRMQWKEEKEERGRHNQPT